MFFTDRQDFSLPVGSYIFCSEAFAFESIFRSVYKELHADRETGC